MKKYLSLILVLSCLLSYSQQYNLKNVPSGWQNTAPLSLADAIALNSIEKLELPEEYRNKSLPDSVDNSQYEWFRPIFSQQVYPNCMQSTSIAYSFTYEINRLRGLPSDTADNQYTTHFAWNFFNGGNGYYGVNYLFTMDVLKYHGTPTVADYGGMYYGGGERWMSGYEAWENAMNNRISGIKQIYVGNKTGLLTLKHWLNDHLDGSATGGVASFIACSPYGIEHLPAGTPNAGKSVVTHFCDQASHGMTIVGYNDSIRFDYNGDGQYTNHIDLNGDGKINISDWEIGGVKMANSHGVQFADSGFAYMMYKTLADNINDGGIWSNRVHVVFPKEEHHTRMTYKISLEHDYRERIRVRSGISADPSANQPDHIVEYSILNFQGGNHYMQGNDTTDQHKTLEFGLDVTPLLSYVEPGQPCKLFLMVDERDKENLGTGQVKYFSVIDLQDGGTEYVSEQLNVPLIENGTTMLSVVMEAPAGDVAITTGELPVYEAGTPMDVQLEAQGGEPPYTWALDRNYFMAERRDPFPGIDAHQIISNSYEDSAAIQTLDFSFPFYGKRFDSVLVSSSGYLQFDENMFFWSYLVDLPYFLKSNRVIAPLLCPYMVIHEAYQAGVWYEGDENKATFRWKTTLAETAGESELNFAVSLYPDGHISFHYGEMDVEEEAIWISGISYGDKINNSLPALPALDGIDPGTRVDFYSGTFPETISLDNSGMLHIQEDHSAQISDVKVVVTDNTLLQDRETFFLTDGLELRLESAGNYPGRIPYGQFSNLKLFIRNRGNAVLQDINLNLSCSDPRINIAGGNLNIETLEPGESQLVEDAFSCMPDADIPDEELIILLLYAQTSGQDYSKEYFFNASAPEILLHDYFIDNPTHIMEPGVNTDISISIYNAGSRKSTNTHAKLICDHEGIMINDSLPESLGTTMPGAYALATFNVMADPSIPYGTSIDFNLQVWDEAGLVTDLPFFLRVGKTPVCIVDMDPDQHSGPGIKAFLDQMSVESDYTQAFPSVLDNYQAVILCLGVQFSFHEVTYGQSLVLSEYLDRGGKIYMEGRVVWEQDDQWPLFDRFMLETTSEPALYETLVGVDSTFTSGLAYANTATQPFSYYYLEPVAPAFSILTGKDFPFCAGVAYDGGDYKTIGTIFELGALESSDTCLIEDYLWEVLDFFEVLQSSLGIEEVPPGKHFTALQNYPNPMTNTTRIPLILDRAAYVDARIYDINGRMINILINESRLDKGRHILHWDGTNQSGRQVPGGIYFYRLIIDGISHTGKMVLVR